MLAVRFALFAPLAAALASVPWLLVTPAQNASIPLADESRIWFYIVAPAVFALVAMYAASMYAAWIAGPDRLPRFARAAVEMNRIEPLPEGGLARHSASLPGSRRFRLAVRTFAEASVLLFLAVPVPVVLLGYLVHPGIYRAEEAVIVGLFAAVEIGWVAFLLRRYAGWMARV
jgi:hypothetical protein